MAIATFVLAAYVHNKVMKNYVLKEYGKKWLTVWGYKLYFWQSSVFVSTLTTLLVVFLLKWSNVITF